MNFLCRLGFHKKLGCHCLRCTKDLHRWSEDGAECLVCGLNPSKRAVERAENEAKIRKADHEAAIKYVLIDRAPKEPEERESVPLAETREQHKLRKEMEDLRRLKF